MKRVALSSFTFALLAISYAVYARVIVPRIEPPLPPLEARHFPHAAPTRTADPGGPQEARDIARRAFGDDAPEVTAPFVWQFSSEQTTVYFFTQGYQEAANHQAEWCAAVCRCRDCLVLKPLSIVIDHAAGAAAEGPDGQATTSLTTVHCPQARIQFDKLDMRRLQAGKPIGVLLEGAIEMHHYRPGDEEPFILRTRDVGNLNAVESNAAAPPRLATDAPVEFSHGPDEGTGQGLDIFLIAPADERTSDGGLAVSGIASLRIRRKVRFVMRVDPEAASFSRLAGRPDASGAPSDAEPIPLEIRCDGPFQYSFEKDTASFRDAVEVLRPVSDSETERLQCEQLELLFDRKGAAAQAAAADAPAGLTFRRLQATGKPVLIDSPPNNFHVLATFLSYDAELGRTVLFNEDASVLITDEAGEMHAGRITLNQDEQAELASLRADGPGRLWRRDEKSGRDLRARWGRQLSVERDGELYVLRLRGRAALHATAQGSLEAEKIDVWLRPKGDARDAATGATAAGDKSDANDIAGMEPVRLEAEGAVRVESPQVAGNVRRLEMRFDEPGTAVPAGGVRQPAARAVASPRKRLADAQGGGTLEGGKLRVDAGLLRVQLLRVGGEARVTQVWADGDIDARQEATAGGGPAGLALKGKTLHLRDVGGHEKLRLTGSPAEVRTDEMALNGQVLHLDRAANRLDVDGAGILVLAVDRDFDGRQLDQSKQLEIRWSGDLTFDGASAVFRKAVEARLEATRILCHQMDVVLERPISFSDPPGDVRGAARIRRLVCKADPALASSKVELLKEVVRAGKLVEYQHGISPHLVFESSTGDIRATGPGEFVSVAPGDDPGFGLGFEGPRAAAQRPATADPGLKRLHIRYAQSMTGNLNERRVTFHDRVDVLYGPVQSAEQVLDRHRLPQDGLWLRSDTLDVAQEDEAPGRSSQLGQQPAETESPVLMIATGDVKADVYRNALYSTLAHRISYSEVWDRLIIEGSGSNQAMLTRQLHPGGNPDRWVGDRITFHLRDQRLKVDGGTTFEGQP